MCGNAQGPGGQRMFAISRSDAPCQRTKPPQRAGVAVGADHSDAGQGDALFGGDDVHNTLMRIRGVKQAQA